MKKRYVLKNTLLTLSLLVAGALSAQRTVDPISRLSVLPTSGASGGDQALRGGGPPVNDECGSVTAQALEVGGNLTFTGNNLDATVTGDYVPGSALDADGTPSVWHSFTTTECSNVTVSYCNTDPAFENVWVILTPSCPAGDDYLVATSYDFTTCATENVTLVYFELPAGTWYLPVMLDVEFAAGPYEIEVSAVACGGEYCPAGAASIQYEKISNVTVAGINNTTSSTAGYEDHTAVVGNMATGIGYALSVTISDAYPTDQVLVWIDMDQDNSFGEDELVYTSTLGEGPHTGTITLPGSATTGSTRMRVRLHDTDPGAGPNDTPCGNSSYGQVEDYTVVITTGSAPENDECGSVNSLPLPVDGNLTFTGTTLGATATGDYVPGSALEDSGNSSVWHAFTTTECSIVTVSYCNTDPGFGNVWVILTPTCPAGDDYVLATSYDFTTCAVENVTLVYFELPAGTWYLPVMFDAEAAAGPYEIEVSAVACGGDYCPAGAASTQYEKISNVTVADINNTSSSTAGYEDHTAVIGNMARGTGYPISVTISEPYPTDQVLVWVDLDQDNSFSEAELVYTSTLGEGPHTGTITLPLTAMLGNTRMRVRLHDTDAGPNDTPCGNSSYGQVEDYTINVEISTGINDAEEIVWSVFPNPTEGELNIRTAGLEGTVQIELFDMTGRVVLTEQRMFTNGAPELLNVSAFAAGTYMLRLSTADQRHETPVMVR